MSFSIAIGINVSYNTWELSTKYAPYKPIRLNVYRDQDGLNIEWNIGPKNHLVIIS